MVKALDRKLLRDLRRLSGQMITIALVVAAGIAAFVALRGTYTSIQLARTAYYERQRFADVFASLERAPESVGHDLARIPGVARVQTRVVEPAMLPLDDVTEPLRAQVLSVGAEEVETLNRLHLREGRWVEAGRSDEVLLLSSFADARKIQPGDRVPVVMNGKKREMRVAGIVLSPEFVFAITAGDMAPDPERLAVMWMSRDALAATFSMEGAFNSVALALQPGASVAGVIDAADRMLEPFGTTGAYSRDKQPSNYAIDGELAQLRAFSRVLPLIFLAVASLLVNVVLSRLVHLQRPEIATLKAVGYSDLEVGVHFFKLVLVIGVLGAAAGVGVGIYFGDAMVGLYAHYFKFPNLVFTFDAAGASAAILVSFAAALVGAFSAVRGVVRMAPAEAMRPPAPARYRRSLVDLFGLARALGPSLHMIVRELQRRPLRTLFSALAIAASVGLMVIGGWYYDGIDELIHTQFHEVLREDVTVTFIDARPERAVRDLSHVPGVLSAEGLRVVPVRFRAGHVYRDSAIVGYPAFGDLRQLRDRYARPAPLPPDGIVLTDVLAQVLGVQPGDSVSVEIHEGQRAKKSIVVAGVVDEAFGLQGHMTAASLARFMGESPKVNVGLLRADPALAGVVDARLKDMPHVMSVTRRANLLKRFEEQSASMIVTMAMIVMAFAATITIGVVYNNARVALSIRSRDLASLRVLGFTRGEISSVLLGEMALQVLIALPLGLWFGKRLVVAIASTVDPEQWRMPIVLTPRSYALAALVAILASAFSALLVRRRLDKLDLIGVLKTRE
jgi:putative ABC transport system permease protein